MAKHPKKVSSESSPPQKKTKGLSLSLSSAPSSPPHQDPPAPRKSLADLPDDILENVFTFLPIKNAVKACTVSTKFKTSWTFNRKFMFGRDFALPHNNRQRLVALIDRIFDSHKGPEIQCFHLHIDPENIESLIKKWLKICIAKGMQELEFNFYQRGFTLVSDFLEIQTLKILRLYNCGIVLPPVMSCSKNLHTVVLRQLELTEEMLEKLLFFCKMMAYLDLANCSKLKRLNIDASKHRHLKTLKIACCYEVQRIEIDAPTLRCFHYRGALMKIQFAQVVKLDQAIFSYLPTRNYIEPSRVGSLIKHLAHVRVLTTTALFQEALTARVRNGVFQEPQFSLGKLRELQLFMEGGIFSNPYDIAVFIKNCPSLERLFIDLTDYNFECGMIWDLHHKPMLDSFNHYFDRLRIIKIKSLKFSQCELELLKVLVEKSRFLEYLILITPKSGRTKLYLPNALNYRELINTWQTPPNLRVALFHHASDKSGVFPSHPRYWY